jgi:hypothetical protein
MTTLDTSAASRRAHRERLGAAVHLGRLLRGEGFRIPRFAGKGHGDERRREGLNHGVFLSCEVPTISARARPPRLASHRRLRPVILGGRRRTPPAADRGPGRFCTSMLVQLATRVKPSCTSSGGPDARSGGRRARSRQSTTAASGPAPRMKVRARASVMRRVASSTRFRAPRATAPPSWVARWVESDQAESEPHEDRGERHCRTRPASKRAGSHHVERSSHVRPATPGRGWTCTLPEPSERCGPPAAEPGRERWGSQASW